MIILIPALPVLVFLLSSVHIVPLLLGDLMFWVVKMKPKITQTPFPDCSSTKTSPWQPGWVMRQLKGCRDPDMLFGSAYV